MSLYLHFYASDILQITVILVIFHFRVLNKSISLFESLILLLVTFLNEAYEF